MSIIAMIPARMGSQRLAKKNLRELDGVSLIARAIRRCRSAGCFDEIWVNSEHVDFGPIAEAEGAMFHQRPEHLGSDTATSEDFVEEFLQVHPCDWLVQVHSIAPLVTVAEVQGFAARLRDDDVDALLSCEPIQIECAMGGQPVNFTFDAKTNSQDLTPIQRISWSLTAWRRTSFLAVRSSGGCGTYAGRVGFFPLGPLAAHVIKTEQDLAIAESLLPIVEVRGGTTT
jgi:CMP-N-acetylneuraminic acid synthetase